MSWKPNSKGENVALSRPWDDQNENSCETVDQLAQRAGTVRFTVVLDGHPCFRWAGPQKLFRLSLGACIRQNQSACR